MGLNFFKKKYKNYGVEKADVSVANFLPYLCHYNEDTIITKDGSLMTTLKIEGFSFETADDDMLESRKQNRNNLLKGMANASVGIYFHTLRRKHTAFPGGEFNNYFPNVLNEQWRKKHNPEHVFINEHYVTIVRKPSGSISGLSDQLGKILNGASPDGQDQAFMTAYNELNEMRDRLINGLYNYKVTLLGVKKTDNGNFCSLLEFLGLLVNGGYRQKMLVPRISIDKYLAINKTYLGKGVLEIIGPGYHKFAGLVSVKEYRPATFAGILDNFLQLPFEFIITQTYSFSDRMVAIGKMQLQQRRLVQSEDVAVSQIYEINSALDAAMSGAFAFGDHHISVMCFSDTEKGIDSNLSQAIVEFSSVGIAAVREHFNMDAAYWAQFPCNFGFIVRKSVINTLNLASFASLHNYPPGKAANNHWGPAVTVLNTTSGTPYFFNFHVRDVGHTMIIGPTGAGKTVLLNFLCAQAQKFNPRTFFFDKDRGAEIFIRAINGEYMIIDPGKHSGFNPLQLPDSSDNRNFLVEWFKVLLTSNGETMTADDIIKINTAVDGNYRLQEEERTMANLAPFFGLETPGSLASRLKIWYGNGAKARIFDNPKDLLDFNKSRSFGFEMAEILKDKVILSPVLLYIFQRITASLDGTPTMIVLDEAWALIDNPVFGPKIKDWLKVLRKLNAFVVFATQSVEDAAKSAISDTLVQQTATQIYLPNLKATIVYRDVFMLTERELALVKNTDPSSRYFLIKQDSSGVIARIDLSGMTDVVNILSGRADTVRLLDQIRNRVGDNPLQWIPIFWQEVRAL